MPQRSIYDTRFFVEYFYSKNPDFLKKLKEDLQTTRERMVSVITIHEIHRIDTEKEGREVATMRSETIRRDFKVLGVDYETAIKSAVLRTLHPVPMADSLIAATANLHGCAVVSDDPHFKTLDVKTRWYVINP